MLQDLGNRMEAWIKKIQEIFNKDLEELKNEQSVMNKNEKNWGQLQRNLGH